MRFVLATIFCWLAVVVSIFIFAGNLSSIFFVATPVIVERGPVLPMPEIIPEVEAKEIDIYFAPTVVKGIYLTSTSALNSELMSRLIDKINQTEINAVVINVNDKQDSSLLSELAPVIEILNKEEIHTIARIATFQNEKLVNEKPELALKWPSGSVWYDGGGHRWVDPASPEVWDEIEKLSLNAIEIGFREINYDYVRFPSDGAIGQAIYPVYNGKSKSDVINSFGDAMRSRIKSVYPEVILSADIFAHTILVENDAGIGQNFVEIVDHFDVIAPMVYPSHYAPGNFGYENPATAPYAITYGTMAKAKAKLVAVGKEGAVIRPWFQDFDMGAYYGPNEVRAQFEANADAGFEQGWFLWNARNVYTESAWLTNETTNQSYENM